MGNNGYNIRQHSFRKNRGTHTATSVIYENIAHSQQDHEQYNVVLRDVAKGFDKVWHDGLKYKIIRLNLPTNITALLCNVLDDRSATVCLDGYMGEKITLKSGVPQGRCLSPTLFNLFT